MSTATRMAGVIDGDVKSAEGLSQSALKMAVQRPLLYDRVYVQKIQDPPPPTPDMIRGSNLEAYIKAGGPPDDIVIIPYSVLNKDGHRKGKAWQVFAEQHHGRRLMKQSEYDEEFGQFELALENLRQHQTAWDLINGCQWHVGLHWRCPKTGLWRKGETDLINPDRRIIVEIKSANRIDEHSFLSALWQYGYDIQGSTYLEGAQTVFGGDDWIFAFILSESKPPFTPEVYQLPDQMVDLGRRRNEAFLDRFIEMQKTGNWKPTNWGKQTLLYPEDWMLRAMDQGRIQ